MPKGSAAPQQPDHIPDGRCGKVFLLCAFRPATDGLPHGQTHDDGKQDTWCTNNEESHPPAKGFRDPAAQCKSEQDADIDADGIDRQGEGAILRFEYV